MLCFVFVEIKESKFCNHIEVEEMDRQNCLS